MFAIGIVSCIRGDIVDRNVHAAEGSEVVSSANRVHSFSAAMVAPWRDACVAGRYDIRSGPFPWLAARAGLVISAPFSAIRAADSLGASSDDRELFQKQEINLHPIELPGKPVVVRNPVRCEVAG